MRRFVGFLGAVCFSTGLFATPSFSAQAAEERPMIYVVKKGDTLWGLSERFVKDPKYWPTLWASNHSEITNPHRIFPGQKLAIYSDRIEFLPAVAEAKVEEAPLPPKPAKEAPLKVGFSETDALEYVGVVVEGEDSRRIFATGDEVFATMTELDKVRIGEKYLVFKAGEDVLHPVTKEKFGCRIYNQGVMQVTDVGVEVAVGKIIDGFEEISPGSRLRPYIESEVNNEVAETATDAIGVVVAAAGHDARIMGQGDYVIIDLGAQDDLKVGNLLKIGRSRKLAKDKSPNNKAVVLPDLTVGEMRIVQVYNKAAIALVIKTERDIIQGDKVSAK